MKPKGKDEKDNKWDLDLDLDRKRSIKSIEEEKENKIGERC